MKCPHCTHSIHFEESGESIYQLDEGAPDGIALKHGFCPNCQGLIVLLDHGTYYMRGQYDAIRDVHTTEILYPRFQAREPLPSEVTNEYRKDFEEAANVISVSPKASAAISRRLLQHTLREQFGIKANSLAAEIDEFMRRSDVPSHLAGAVDAVRNVGNLAAHPMKDQNTGGVVDVEPGEAEWLLDVLEALFDFCFVQPKRLEERKDQLNRKLATLGKPPMKS